MKHIIFLVLFLSLTLIGFSQKQKSLILQHRKNSNKTKILNYNDLYKFKIADTIIVSKIVHFSDSTFSIVKIVETDIDTIYKFPQYENYEVAGKKYYKDTIAVRFSELEFVKIARFKNRDFAILPAYLGLASTVAIPIVAIGSLIDSGQVDLETLVIVASISAISWTIIFIATRNKRFDTQKKWTLTTR